MITIIKKGAKLKRKPLQLETIYNKRMYSDKIEDRYELFSERCIDPKLSKDDRLQITEYYPTSDFKDVLNEIIMQIPTEFSPTGTESDFLRKALVEESHLKNMLTEVYREIVLGVNAYVLMRPTISESSDTNIVFNFEVLPSEDVWATYSDATGEVETITTQERLVTYSDIDEEVIYLKTMEYTMDKINVYYRDVNGERLGFMVDTEADNPFKKYNMLPIIEFKGYQDGKDTAMANKLREPQLQMDNVNTNVENLINIHVNPLTTIEKAFQDWNSMETGAGSILSLRGDEKLNVHAYDMQLIPIGGHIVNKRDNMYKTGGLTPPTLRDKMFGTDSSKVTRIANAELIAIAKIIITFSKRSVNRIAKVLMEWNNKTLTNESLVPPTEVLPFDLESVLNQLAIGMNLGVLDDEWFWTRYMPELDSEGKKRIKDFFDGRNDLSMGNTNTDNIAKVGQPTGNKESATMSKEERDGDVGKET